MPQIVTRRELLRSSGGIFMAASVLSPRVALAAPAGMIVPKDLTLVQDFDELWRTLDERYAYFANKATDWAAVRRFYRPQAANAVYDRTAFKEVVWWALNELYDPHSLMADPPQGSPRFAFHDLVVTPEPGGARIIDIMAGSAAAASDLKHGELILAVDGRPIETVARELMPRCLSHPDPEAKRYATNLAVAGRRGQPRVLTVENISGTTREVLLPLFQPEPKPDLEWSRLPNGAGLIVIRSFADDKVTTAFDEALLALRDAPGLIIDVRQNGGGDTAVAVPITGRFIPDERVYALMRRRLGPGLGAPRTERVPPRGPFTYTAPVVVLTSRWSASMAEGFPMGMRAIGRATLVGTPMMGLGAGVFPIRLDHSGLQAQYSAEPVYDPQDRPRSSLRPDIEVEPGQDIMAAGVAKLNSLMNRARP